MPCHFQAFFVVFPDQFNKYRKQHGKTGNAVEIIGLVPFRPASGQKTPLYLRGDAVQFFCFLPGTIVSHLCCI